MSDLGVLFLLIGATYRIVRFVQRDGITVRPREWLYDRHPPDPERARWTARWDPKLREMAVAVRPGGVREPVSALGQMVACPWCLSVWVALVVVVIVDAWYYALPMPVLWWLAVSAGVGIADRAGGV